MNHVMRIGRIVAVTAGAALAVFGAMQLKRSRGSDAGAPGSDESPPLDLTTPPPSTNADQSRLTAAAAD
jgi:hypothetical protein